jgi:hypothetical protein
MTTRLSPNLFRSGRWLLFGMLVLLHVTLWLGADSIWARPLLLTHLGLFLLWQPLWRGEHEVSLGSSIAIVCASGIGLFWLNWWMLAFWVSGLFALVGGRVFAFRARWTRVLYLAVMAYLLATLLFWVAPHLFELRDITESVEKLMGVALPVLLAGMLLLPVEEDPQIDGSDQPLETAQSVDFFYSLMLFMLLTLLVLGSLAFMTLAHVEYLEALLRTLFLMAAVLFSLGWLWNPRFGFGGLQPLFSRYLLNVGTPFESWLKQLAANAQHEQSPTAFLMQATSHLAALPWLSGVAWEAHAGQSPIEAGRLGSLSPHAIEVEEQGLRLTLYSKQAITPSILLHIHLLTEMLGHFYQAKCREQRLREVTRLQAVYETGARLTHDLKNMLQSLLVLTSITQRREEEGLPILRRQLPVLVQRIELTLSKLSAPKPEVDSTLISMAVWWENLRQRYQYAEVEWRMEGRFSDEKIPAALFDCVADNLIDNAYNKRQQQPGLHIRASLSSHPFSFNVFDNGTALHEAVARQVLHTIVPSESGLGIGLYQAARWAAQLNYQMTLSENIHGAVNFKLTEL